MATDVNVAVSTEAPLVAPPPRATRKLLFIGGLVALMVAVPGGVAWLLLRNCGGAAATEAHPEQGETAHRAASTDADESDDATEVAIGDFNCSNGTASPGSILHVEFKMSALTTAKRVASLEQLMKTHHARIRGSVNRIVRGSSLEELNDANLFTIRRRLREELNRLFRKNFVAEVVITDFRVVEQ